MSKSFVLFANNERSNNAGAASSNTTLLSTVYTQVTALSTFTIFTTVTAFDGSSVSVVQSLSTIYGIASGTVVNEGTIYQNESVFYRTKQTGPYPITIKIIPSDDVILFDQGNGSYDYAGLSSLYIAEYGLNVSDSSVQLTKLTSYEPFVVNFSIEDDDSIVPTVCSIFVQITSFDTNGSILTSSTQHISMSAVFLDAFPRAEFVAFPKYVVNESTYPPTVVEVNTQNYASLCNDVEFYGEGHTETIYLSATTPNVDDADMVYKWFVGTGDVGSVRTAVRKFYVEAISSVNMSFAKTLIGSVSDREEVHEIGVLAACPSRYITTSSPVITYNDTTGRPSFYPFYTSTTDISGNPVLLQDKLATTIKVRKYPEPRQLNFQTPFQSTYKTLPYDNSSTQYKASVTYNPLFSGFLTEVYEGAHWSVKANSVVGDWTVDAITDKNIVNYLFDLSYDPDYNINFLPLFKTSLIADTNLHFSVSALKTVQLKISSVSGDLPSGLSDWLPKTVAQVYTADSNILGKPLRVRPYTPNYYNIAHEPVQFTLTWESHDPLSLSAVELRAKTSPDVLTLTPTVSTGYMVFNKIGKVDLDATVYLVDTHTSLNGVFNIPYSDMIEVVPDFDDVRPKSYRTLLSPYTIDNNVIPLLSPNEWLDHRVINNVLSRLQSVVDQMINFSELYQPKHHLYAWFGFNQNISPDLIPDIKYKWMDLECAQGIEGLQDGDIAWFDVECENPNIPEQSKKIKWEDHECKIQRDPACVQKYCLEWNWKQRKSAASDTKISWRTAKKYNVYEKKWQFESCEIDSQQRSCRKTDWFVSAFDQQAFPIPYGMSGDYCKFTGACYIPNIDKIIVSQQQELKLLDNSIDTNIIARRGTADENFSFQDIAGIAINSEGRIFVLDKVIPRVSVFQIKFNKFSLFRTWGDAGTVLNNSGFLKPNDIHVDQDGFVWITDTGNFCIKKFSSSGKPIKTITSKLFEESVPKSLCVDSEYKLHVLTEKKVLVFDLQGTFIFEYELGHGIQNVNKINTCYNREMVYVSYRNGVSKFFRTGVFAEHLVVNYECNDGGVLDDFGSVCQDQHRSTLIVASNAILKYGDLMKLVQLKGPISVDSLWTLDDILIGQEEYVQPWVYLKAFHRIWDNIETLRSALLYEGSGCKAYVASVYDKADLVIGQNELVTNTVINRLTKQLWANITPLIKYFDPECKN